eukprot:NODE_7587_length_314_cov_13.200000_g6849_i0.p1 GENE.NODE_7587_length_314_cov_13.200000_g6849_i0~~NODE_7587_length_314_cov_13.200000_g6849_i0.p1  ORF type:complete len:71 (+),score=12.48 NODE_7587_length_314_cov_13.200000_g6849_i0:71-283(+)
MNFFSKHPLIIVLSFLGKLKKIWLFFDIFVDSMGGVGTFFFNGAGGAEFFFLLENVILPYVFHDFEQTTK